MNPFLSENTSVLALGWMLVHSLWQITLLAGLIRLLWWIFPGREARLRYGIALVALALIPLISALTFYHFQQSYSPAHKIALTQVIQETGSIASWSGQSNQAFEDALSALKPAMPGPEKYALMFSFDSYLPYLVGLWLLGELVLGLRLAGSWWYMDGVKRKGLLAVPPEWRDRFQKLSRQMQLVQKVQLYFSELVDEPLTLGYLKPVILFPIGLINQLSIDQVEAILLHELAHVRRMDYLVNWLQSIVELLFFYHPAVWWLSREVRQSREHCCDDLAIRQGGASPVLYARTLTQLAALSFTPKNTMAMSVNGIHQSFSARIHRLFAHGKTDRDWRKPVLSLTICLLLGAFLLLSRSDLFAGKQAAIPSSPLPDENVFAVEELSETTGRTDEEKGEVTEISHAVSERMQENLAWSTNPILANSTVSLPENSFLHPDISGAFQPPVALRQSPLFIVDGIEIPDDAPFELMPQEIGKDHKILLPDSEEGKAFGVKGRHGVVKLTTKDGNWSGGKPYRPMEILGYERAQSGREDFAMVDGQLLEMDEKQTINQLTLHWIVGLHGIGIYDEAGQLIYGKRTPIALERLTTSLELGNGYTLVSGIYQCDNTIYLKVFYTLAGEMSALREALREQMNDRVFPDVKRQKAYCDKKTTIESAMDVQDQQLMPEPLFVIDGEPIDPAATYTVCSAEDLKQEKFLLPAEAVALYGKKAAYGAAILKSQKGKWPGGKPYRPLVEIFKKSFADWYLDPFPKESYFFVDGRPVSQEVFYQYNFYSFFQGTIMHPKVGAIYGLDGKKADLETIRKKIINSGIAYELTPGLVVVEYFKSCDNNIPIVALCSPLSKGVPAEKNKLQNAVSWEKLAIDCYGESVIDDKQAVPRPGFNQVSDHTRAVQQIDASLKVSPVPFSEEMRVSFTLPERARTKVSIYDLKGKLVQVLVDDILDATLHELSWDARLQPTGIYMLWIQTGDILVTRQLSKQ